MNENDKYLNYKNERDNIINELNLLIGFNETNSHVFKHEIENNITVKHFIETNIDKIKMYFNNIAYNYFDKYNKIFSLIKQLYVEQHYIISYMQSVVYIDGIKKYRALYNFDKNIKNIKNIEIETIIVKQNNINTKTNVTFNDIIKVKKTNGCNKKQKYFNERHVIINKLHDLIFNDNKQNSICIDDILNNINLINEIQRLQIEIKRYFVYGRYSYYKYKNNNVISLLKSLYKDCGYSLKLKKHYNNINDFKPSTLCVINKL